MALKVDIGPSLTWRPIVLKCGAEDIVLTIIIGRIKPVIQILLNTKVRDSVFLCLRPMFK